ncbi:unannotated protein [freshwater metagenome]|uniref:Unannotated protein n=1 Tax=freshwater metagenome TaxID=449393 RepID=A0A6J6DEE8_9ZZZZ
MSSSAVIRSQVPHDLDARLFGGGAKFDQRLISTQEWIDMVE